MQVALPRDRRCQADGGDDRAKVSGDRLRELEHHEEALLELDGERIDLVVAVDDRLRCDEVVVEQGVGAPHDRVDHPSRYPHHVALHVVELLVEVPADLSHGSVCPRCDERAPSSERSEEHTSELQSLMRISYAVFCLKKKK